MPTYNAFKALLGKRVCVCLRNGITLNGNLDDVDVFLNLKLSRIDEHEERTRVLGAVLSPHKKLFLRGSFVKTLRVAEEHLQKEKLEEATRKAMLYKGKMENANKSRA